MALGTGGNRPGFTGINDNTRMRKEVSGTQALRAAVDSRKKIARMIYKTNKEDKVLHVCTNVNNTHNAL